MDQLYPSPAAGAEWFYLLCFAPDAGAQLNRYRAAPDEVLRRVALDTMMAIYDRRAGVTHLVAAPVPEILAALFEALDLDALSDKLGAQNEIAALAERLHELVATGLVERV